VEGQVNVALLGQARSRSVDPSFVKELSLSPCPGVSIVTHVFSGPASVHELFLIKLLKRAVVFDSVCGTWGGPVRDVAELLKECFEANLELGSLTVVVVLPSVEAAHTLLPGQRLCFKVLVHFLECFLALPVHDIVLCTTPNEDCLVFKVDRVIDHV